MPALGDQSARNRLADRGRSPQSRPHLSLAEHEGHDEPTSPSPDPLRQAESGQMLSLLRQALFKLPERAREVYLLNRITGMSYTQIARHCGITAKTVEKHIAKGMRLLAEHFLARSRAVPSPIKYGVYRQHAESYRARCFVHCIGT